MSFAAPYYLWLLLIFPPGMLAFFWWSHHARQRAMAQFIQSRLLPELLAGVSVPRQKVRATLLILAVTFLIVALARPRWGYDLEEVSQRGLDIIVAIDTSKSMLAEDIAPNRLGRAKLAALDLMQQAKSDRLGLVAFAGEAFLQCPLTFDDAAFRQNVEALDVNTIPLGGTAIAEAINTAASAFKEGDSYKVLVLLTDGEDQDSGALEAAKAAAQAGLRIFTIGIGTAKGELLRIAGPDGKPDYIRDEQGNVVMSHLNEDLLRQIATATPGGFYLPLRGANTIDTLYQQGLAPLPKSESSEKWVQRPHERYHWPLAVAIALLAAEILFPERKRRTKTRKAAAPGSLPPVLTSAAAMLLLLWLPVAAYGSPSSAMRDYASGKFDRALQEYKQLLATNDFDPRLYFNAGAAAYRAQKFDEAGTNFLAATAAQDLKLQEKAYYNLANTQFQLGQTAKDLDELQQTWEEAIKNYQRSLDLDKTDADAVYNLNFVKESVEQIIRLREAARMAKEAADEATRRRNYHVARTIMDELMKKNIAAKQFKEYTKRLGDIDDIATPRQP